MRTSYVGPDLHAALDDAGSDGTASGMRHCARMWFLRGAEHARHGWRPEDVGRDLSTAPSRLAFRAYVSGYKAVRPWPYPDQGVLA